MSDTNPFSGLPEEVSERAHELHDAGLAPKRAIGLAVSELEYGADWSAEDVADVQDVEETTLRSNKSKAKSDIEDAARLLVLHCGGPATILAEYEPGRPHHPFERVYLTAGYQGVENYDDAKRGERRVNVVTVYGGASGGHPSAGLNINTTAHGSLEALADEKYRDKEFGSLEDAQKWYSLLTDAGIPEDDLETPGKKLPASHPDSADHFNYQMQSLEGPEDRRPPRR